MLFRKQLHLTWLCVAVMANALTAVHAESRMRPGLWEYTVTMDIPNMPEQYRSKMPRSYTRCLTKDDVRQPGHALTQRDSRQQCKQEDFKQTGNTYSFKVRCEGKQAATGTAQFTVESDRFNGKMTISSVSRKGEQREMTQTMSGKRLGECKN